MMRFDRLKAQIIDARVRKRKFWSFWEIHFPSNLSALIRINTHVVSSLSKRRRGQKTTTTIEISLAVVFVFFSREEEEEEEQTREKIRR